MSFPNHKGRPGLLGGSLPKNSLQSLFSILKGGSGSGNFGHKGRPGIRGGSSNLVGTSIEFTKDFKYLEGIELSRIGKLPDGSITIMKYDSKEAIKSEVSAYDVSRILGFRSLVPETIEKEVNDKNYSVQRWVHNDTASETAAFSSTQFLDIDDKSYKEMVILDCIIGNSDRHSSNWLLSPKGKVTAIDHGMAFSSVIQREDRHYKQVYYGNIATYSTFTNKELNMTKKDLRIIKDKKKMKEIRKLIGSNFDERAQIDFDNRLEFLDSVYEELPE